MARREDSSDHEMDRTGLDSESWLPTVDSFFSMIELDASSATRHADALSALWIVVDSGSFHLLPRAVELARRALSEGASPPPGSDFSIPPATLSAAALHGFAPALEILLPYGDPRAPDMLQATALMRAASRDSPGHLACVELLIPRSDLAAADPDGWTALSFALAAGSLVNAKALAMALPFGERLAAIESSLAELGPKSRTHSIAHSIARALTDLHLLSDTPTPSGRRPSRSL